MVESVAAETSRQSVTRAERETFHCFRKMFLSAAIYSGIGLIAGKMLCGKAIPQSDDTYLTTVKLREKFMQLKRLLTIHCSLRQDVLTF